MVLGKYGGRMSAKQVQYFLRNSHRALPPAENPHGIPSEVMKQLSQENLSADPAKFNTRLKELLQAYKLNQRG
jgi:NAD(P)H-dependent FMN reductase